MRWMNSRAYKPGKGVLRILKHILELEKLLGRNPVGWELHAYKELKTGLTCQDSETLTEMRRHDLIVNENGFVVTPTGKALMEKHGVL